MADNLKYNEPGSGPLVATDDVGSQHFQKFKLDVGGDGVSRSVDGSVPVYIVSGTSFIGITDARLKDGGGADFGTPSNPVRIKAAVNSTDGDAFSANTSEGFAFMGAREDTSPSTLAEDDLGIIRLTQARGQHVNLRNDTGTEIGTASNPVRFDPTNTTAQEVNQGLGSPAAADAWLVSGTLNISNIQTSAEIKFIRVNATADGDNTIISGVTNKKIRVLGYALTVTTAATITIQDTAGTPNIFAQFSLAAQGGVSYPGGLMSPAFETLVGNGVEINTAAGQDCLGHMTYIEV